VNRDGRIDRSHAGPNVETGPLVPKELRSLWDLRLGDARELLPPAVTGGIGFFLHDSDHSHAHQEFEYETAWVSLEPGGILGSDDTDWSSAWSEFLERHRGSYHVRPNGPLAVRAVRKTKP
jgi:hypothetical protein